MHKNADANQKADNTLKATTSKKTVRLAKAKEFLTDNKSTSKVTVKKIAPKGTYKFKVKVTAKGNNNYKSGSKTFTVAIVVK